MAGNKAAIKSRIKSINTTKKITGAMELISTVKLQKYRILSEKIITYENAIEETIKQIASSERDLDTTYLKRKDGKKLFFVFCSDMGLCGGYNINLLKLLFENIKENDELIIIGTKIYKQLKDRGYHIINEMTPSDKIDYFDLKKYSNMAIQMYKDKTIDAVNVVYTNFINNVSFKSDIKKVLPLEIIKEEKYYPPILFEPSPNEVFNDMIPIFVENDIYRLFIESKTSEHGSRRYAMENATNNADELNEELLLAYNQARQASITSEITEIVAGADAL